MAVYNYTVTQSGNQYLINGQANPVLALEAGNTYVFSVNTPGNPFWIKTDRVLGSDASYDAVTNNGDDVGNVTIELPAGKVPPKLFYQSGSNLLMGNSLTKFTVPAESIANLIVDQLPDFVRADHPKFQIFMEAYYEWMNQPGNPWNEAKRILDYQDVDNTVDDFLSHLEKEYVALIPKNFDGDIRTLIKNIKDFYVTKGSPKSYEFLFNILFNETIEFYYPKKDILRASDGKWVSDTTIKITNPYQYDVFELSGQEIRQEEYYFDTEEERYMFRDKASATVERAVQFFLGGELVTELYLSKVVGEFTSATTMIDNTDTNAFDALPATAKIYWFDDLGNKHEYKIEPLLTGVNITDPGSNYEPDDVLPVVAQNLDTGVNAIAQIKSVLSNSINTLNIVDGGTNYKIGDILVFNNIGTSGTGAAGFVTAVDGTGTVPNSGAITELRLVSGGFGYKKLPLVSVSINDPFGERQGLNTPTPPTILADGDNIGGIKEIQIINFGALYYDDPIIDFSAKGNGDAVGASYRGGLARYPGTFSNDDGWLSAAKYLQDNKFYQEFSYVIRTGLSINAYRDTIKTLVHPAGMELFGEVFISSKVETGLYNNGVNDVNDTRLLGGIQVPRYIKLLQFFQSEFQQAYLQNYQFEIDGIKYPKPQNIDRHFHNLKITDKLGEDTKAVAASMGQFVRASLEWTDTYGDTQTNTRLLTITEHDEDAGTLTGTLSDGAIVTLNLVATEYATSVSGSQSVLYWDFTGTYDKAFNDNDGTYTATVTVDARYRNHAVGLLPKLVFPKQEIGNVRIDMSPEQWTSEAQPGTINFQPIIHTFTPIDPALTRAGFIGAANVDFLSAVPVPSKTTYTFLGVINRWLIQDGLKHQHADDDIQLSGDAEYGLHQPHREPFGVQIANITGGDATIDMFLDADYRQFGGFTGTRPVKKEKIRHTKVFKLSVGMSDAVESTGSRIYATRLPDVEVDVTKTVVIRPNFANVESINNVLIKGYKYFSGKIADTLNRDIAEWYGRDIVPSRQIGANGGPSKAQITLATFSNYVIGDYLDKDISDYYIYAANVKSSVEIDLPTQTTIDRFALDATDIILSPIKVSVSAIEFATQARQDNYVSSVSVPKLVDNAFYSGNTNFGMSINILNDFTIEEIESGVIRGYFQTVNPQETVVYTRDNLDQITGTY